MALTEGVVGVRAGVACLGGDRPGYLEVWAGRLVLHASADKVPTLPMSWKGEGAALTNSLMHGQASAVVRELPLAAAAIQERPGGFRVRAGKETVLFSASDADTVRARAGRWPHRFSRPPADSPRQVRFMSALLEGKLASRQAAGGQSAASEACTVS